MELEQHLEWDAISRTRRISIFLPENSYIEMIMLSIFLRIILNNSIYGPQDL